MGQHAGMTYVPGKPKSPRVAEVSPRPIVKVGVFSNRPQRYSKCIIKENDAFIMTIVAGTIEPVKKPMRIMMNNMTISIFNDDNYQELNYSYDLARTKLVVDTTKWCCFTLEDNLILNIKGFHKHTSCSFDFQGIT